MKYIKGFLNRYKIKNTNRSFVGDILLFAFLLLFGTLSIWPLLYALNNAFKPLDEIFMYPPKLFVQRPTLDNFRDLFYLLNSSRVPMSRYIFNTLFITFMGTLGSIFIASLAAFPLAKYDFKGKKVLNKLIVYALMFNSTVLAIPNYLVISWFHLTDTIWSIILPVMSGTLGLYLIKNFMVQIPTVLIESAKIDGANEFYIYRKIMLPLAKPAVITLIILQFNTLWSATGGIYIYTQEKKPLSYAIGQIVNAGIARTGASSAVTLIMLIVPIAVFIISQSNVLDTFQTSGIKD